LSAKRTHLILVVAGVAVGALCDVEPITAQVTGSSTQAAAPQPLTRDDVDVLLRQARSAIAQGNLDEADALVKRAEDTRAHYPFFHMGPTPTSVRRELNRARRVQPSSGKSATRGTRNGLGLFGGANRAPQSAATDPFLQRDPVGAHQTIAPSVYGGQSDSTEMPGGDISQLTPAVRQSMPPVPVAGQDVVNPYLAQNGGAPMRARYDAQSEND
jgi:hypothetical protein